MLSEWLKEAVSASLSGSKRILILQLDAFPVSDPPATDKLKKWYYQLFSPINTMLTVRSEGQIVRDTAVGEDLQKVINADGFQTTWMLVRYTPPAAGEMTDGVACPLDPPLSWHLTPKEQLCIDAAWKTAHPKLSPEVNNFLAHQLDPAHAPCRPYKVVTGVVERQCPAQILAPAQADKK